MFLLDSAASGGHAAWYSTMCLLDISKATGALFPPTLQPGSLLPQCKGFLLPLTRKRLTCSYFHHCLRDIRVLAMHACRECSCPPPLPQPPRSLPPAPSLTASPSPPASSSPAVTGTKARPSPWQLGLTSSLSLDGKKRANPWPSLDSGSGRRPSLPPAHVAHAPCATLTPPLHPSKLLPSPGSQGRRFLVWHFSEEGVSHHCPPRRHRDARVLPKDPGSCSP